MNSSACSAVICQPSGHEQKHDIGAQCGATAPDRTVQVPVIVNQILHCHSKSGLFTLYLKGNDTKN